MFGEHMAKCLQCGKRWMVGDCIPSFCSDECRQEWERFWERNQQANRETREAEEAKGGHKR